MSEAAPADDGAMNVEAAEEALPSGEEEFDEPSAEDSDADSSNEEDEAEDEFEEDGFVVDEAEEGEEEEDSIKKRKKKKRVREYVPDEDDLDLLEEHGVVVRPMKNFCHAASHGISSNQQLKRQKPGRRRLQQAGDAQHMAANANEMQDELFLADGELVN